MIITLGNTCYRLFKANFLYLFIISSFFLVGCKKDQLIVNETREYRQADFDAPNPFDGGWALTLQPGGIAEVVPGGDINYRGTYKVRGAKVNVKTSQNNGSYTFDIISETEIRETSSKVILKLVN